MNKYYEIYEPEVTEVTSKCSPVETGYIANGGWNWSYPAIARVAGTAGNLEKWVTGFKDVWEDINDPSKTEESFRWGNPGNREAAWEWLDSKVS